MSETAASYALERDAAGVPALEAGPCATCGTGPVGPYCHACGERRLGLEGESLGRFLREQVHEVTSADGRLWRTVKALFVPGKLTDEYARGRRSIYVRPVRIFLVVNVVLFFYMSGSSGSVLKGPLATYYDAAFYGPAARALAESRAGTWGLGLEAFEAAFDARATALAPSLIAVLIPAFALAAALALWPLGRSGVRHLVFATHSVAAFMAWSLVLMTALSLGHVALVLAGLEVGDSIDPVLVPLMALSLVAYLVVAVRRVYRAPWWGAAVSGVALGTAGFAFAFWLYRAALFAFTFWTLDPPA